MDVVSVIGGLVLIALVAREVFHTLFHPGGRGELTLWVFRLVWALTGRFGQRARALSGPLAMVSVIMLWVVLMTVGWALVYWPALPDGFILASPLDPSGEGGLIDAIYYSWVTQTTLGYGDIAPLDGQLRMLGPLQATLGFGLLTIVVSWVLSIYPALTRQRSAAALAHAILHSRGRADGARQADDPAPLARQMERLSERLSALRVDLVQYPATYYFAAPSPTLSLARALPGVVELARQQRHGPAHTAASELWTSLEQLAETLATVAPVTTEGDVEAVVSAYRVHHQLI